MSFALVNSRALNGMNAPLVEVEVHLANGLPQFNIVGLPDTEVKESRDRVRAAIVQSGFDFPTKKITVNLAPADLPKESGRFDLPIALGILAASGQIDSDSLQDYEFAGELALSGALRPIRGAIAMAWQSKLAKRAFILPLENAVQAASLQGLVYGATSLAEVAEHFNTIQNNPNNPNNKLKPIDFKHILDLDLNSELENNSNEKLDLSDVKGQHTARLALEIAAAGGHSLLMIGTPGTGKSMLAQRLPSILPPLTENEMIEVWSLHSLLPHNQINFNNKQIFTKKRPFRAPHHSASSAALVGGGSDPKPGEISLANHGVLFLDELPEFDRKVLEMLREPLESGEIHISRATRQATYPAKFQLVAAMNPCPCGYLGHSTKACTCTAESIKRYRNRLSGPLLDRIDLTIEVPNLPPNELTQTQAGESSASVLERVLKARERQYARQGKTNAQLSVSELDNIAYITADARQTLADMLEKLSLSARSYHRILRIARTLADLNQDQTVERTHLIRAIGFRRAI